MTDILLTTLIISLTVLGARTVTDEGMVGFPIREWALKVDERSLFTWMKPLILCCVCMPSVWGLGIHLLIHGWSDIQYYPLEALSAAFINAVLWTLYEIVKKINADYEEVGDIDEFIAEELDKQGKSNKMKYEIQDWTEDGKSIKKLVCPNCKILGIIDDDQYNGKVSTLCGCGFHETINFAELESKE